MLTSENLIAWKALECTARTGSVKDAAVELDMDMSAVSRLVASLETEFGIALLNRHQRPLTMTPEGRALYEPIKDFIRHHAQLTQMTQAMSGEPRRYRLCYPMNVGRDPLIGQLIDYRKIDPAIEFDLMSECDHEDVLEGRVDIAYLPYKPPAKGLLIWSTGLGYNVPLATPDYIAAHGNPQEPEDMKDHTIIVRTGKNYPVYHTLKKASEERCFVWKAIGFQGDALSCKAAVLADLGIAMDLSFDLCKQELMSGELVPVLNGWHRQPWDMNLVMSDKMEGNPQLMRFAQWLADREIVDNKARWAPMFRRFVFGMKPA